MISLLPENVGNFGHFSNPAYQSRNLNSSGVKRLTGLVLEGRNGRACEVSSNARDRVSAYQQMMGTGSEVDHNDRDYPAHQPIDRLNAPFAFAENNFLSISKISLLVFLIIINNNSITSRNVKH